MSFSLVQQMHKKAIPISQSCRVLGVSRAGFYEAKRRDSQPKICKERIQLCAIFASNQKCYGSRRMVAAMREKGMKIGRYRVSSLMKKFQLIPVWKRKFVHTTDSNHCQPVAENILDRKFGRMSPDTAYLGDITYGNLEKPTARATSPPAILALHQ